MLFILFYDVFIKSNIYEKFAKIFLDGDLIKYMTKISENFGKELDEDQIVQLLIDADTRIRLDSIQLLCNYFTGFITTATTVERCK